VKQKKREWVVTWEGERKTNLARVKVWEGEKGERECKKNEERSGGGGAAEEVNERMGRRQDIKESTTGG
jgi:hypothetical protein